MYDGSPTSGLGPAQEVKREKEVPARLQRITRLLTEQSEAIDHLEKELSPILGPQTPNGKEPTPAPTPGSLAGVLTEIAGRIQNHTHWLREVRSRLEI